MKWVTPLFLRMAGELISPANPDSADAILPIPSTSEMPEACCHVLLPVPLRVGYTFLHLGGATGCAVRFLMGLTSHSNHQPQAVSVFSRHLQADNVLHECPNRRFFPSAITLIHSLLNVCVNKCNCICPVCITINSVPI